MAGWMMARSVGAVLSPPVCLLPALAYSQPCQEVRLTVGGTYVCTTGMQRRRRARRAPHLLSASRFKHDTIAVSKGCPNVSITSINFRVPPTCFRTFALPLDPPPPPLCWSAAMLFSCTRLPCCSVAQEVEAQRTGPARTRYLLRQLSPTCHHHSCLMLSQHIRSLPGTFRGGH